MTKINNYEVIIIGAGIAGIGAGNALLKRGVDDFCILEAQNAGGGRIKTLGNKEKGFLDCGAQWIHGEAPDNAIHSTIYESDLVLPDVKEIDGGGDFFSDIGEKLTNDERLISALECFEKMNEEIYQEEFDPCKHSVGSYFYSKFKDFLENIKIPEDLSMYSFYYNWMLRWERIDNACHSIDKISAVGWQDYQFCRGKRNMTPKIGMISVFSEIAKMVEEVIILNSEVTKINFHELSGTCNADIFINHKRPITVTCKNGEIYECNHVIVTCAIGFLKQNLNMFYPQLPENLEKAITRHGFGNIGKIFLEFDTKWWDWKDGSLQLVWTDNLPQFDDTNKKGNHWTKAICGLNEVYVRKNTLVAWIGGEECATMELLPLDDVTCQLIQLLKQFTGNLNIPNPINVYRSEFSTNRFFNGGYSHPIPANDKENIIDTLNIPVYGQYAADSVKLPYLTFAGEANSKHYYSTMHGALENGRKQAAVYCDWRDTVLSI